MAAMRASNNIKENYWLMQVICIVSITRGCYNANDLHMNIRLTEKRKQILKVLECAKEPLSATAVSHKLPDIDLVTIYRNLDLFVQEGFIKKLQFSEEALYEYQKQPHHHAICTDCKKMIHFSVSEADLMKVINLKGFSISNIDITVKGNCQHGTS